MLKNEHLKGFAQFVREHELENITTSYLELVYEYDIPLLKYFTHLSEAEIRFQAEDGLVKFLKGFEEGNALENVKESVRLWEADQLPGVSKLAITQLDIFLIGTAQKIAFLRLLPKYAANAEVPTEILVELEDYYKESQLLTLNALQRIQQEQKEQLEESEERYRNLFDSATDLIQMVSPEGNIKYVNNAWKNTMGYTDEEAKGLNVYNMVVQQDLDVYRDCREQVLQSEGQNGSVAITFIAKDGKLVHVEDSLSAKFKDGKALYSQCIMRDVTERNQAQSTAEEYIKRLEESEANLRQLFENAPDGVVVVDRKMKILSWNPMAEKIFGWTIDEVKGKVFNELLIPKRDLPLYAESAQRFLETGELEIMGQTLEMVMKDKKHREFYVSLNSSPSGQQGQPIYISFIRDIDQMKKVELELNQQRKNLEVANKELEQYAWLASHDLKEPLRKILTFSDMLLTRHATGMDGKVKEGLRKIHGSAYRMQDMIEAVLDYSSIDNDTDDIKLIDLNETLADVLADLEMQVEEKNATININRLAEIEGNPTQIRQLFQNLISNAIKYHKPGIAPVVDIKSEMQNGMLAITVEDNGIGFDEQYSEKMFQIFRRLVSKDDYKGTGIGLALCRKIVANHHGTITATSPNGNGAKFTVTLPLYQRQSKEN